MTREHPKVLSVVGLTGMALLAGNLSPGLGAEEPPRDPTWQAEGGVLEQFGPGGLTTSQSATRTAARRAAGLGTVKPAQARRHIAKANRARSAAQRAEKKADSLRTRAEGLDGQAGSEDLLDLADAQDLIATRQKAARDRQLGAATTALSLPTTATCKAPPTPSPNSTFAVPGWSNAAGWDKAASYESIQLADVTGDGADDLLGRSPSDFDGVDIAELNTTTGVFGGLKSPPPLPAGSLTVRTGDIDGDGQAEIVALTISGEIATLDRDGTTGTWTTLPASSAPVWGKNAEGTIWAMPTHFETLRLVDLDGDEADELVVRGAKGILAARFATDSGGGSWTALRGPGPAPGAPPLSDAGGWNTPENSYTIRIGELDGNPGAELIAFSGSFLVWSYEPSSDTWKQTSAGRLPKWPKTDWSKPAYWTSFRLANIDGDPKGIHELVARGEDGLVLASWDPNTNAWLALPTAPVLADRGGWDKPQYYESLRTGDLDGDGADEVFIRSEATLNVLEYDQELFRLGPAPENLREGPWTVHRSQPLTPSAWAQGSSYRAFRLGDVDGDGADELIGRDPYGIRSYNYADGSLTTTIEPFPAFAAGAECAAYQAVNDFNEVWLAPSKLDFRGAYGHPAVVAELRIPPRRPVRPKGISRGAWRAAWNKVSAQLGKELPAAQRAAIYLGQFGTVAKNSYSNADVDGVAQYFVDTSSKSNVEATIFDLFGEGLSAVGRFKNPDGELTGVNFAASAFGGLLQYSAGKSNVTNNSKVLLTQDELTSEMDRILKKVPDGVIDNQATAPREYGLLLALEAQPFPVPSKPWTVVERANQIYFWQRFTEALWTVNYCDKKTIGRGAETVSCRDYIGFNRDDSFKVYWEPRSEQIYWITKTSNRGDVKNPIGLTTGVDGNPSANDLLFDKPSTTCKAEFTPGCNLGLTKAEFYLGQNGWSIPRNTLPT